ncbi:MAG TPA: type IV toxin-antitoxin system AbiEi family antitoxin domain-containing protein [Gemmatimonadota bacterium]|nr:type IV toxin-antitoxin system AbiEi family antitoxin domain-containing protein [Gemmatimonadota bacterium]
MTVTPTVTPTEGPHFAPPSIDVVWFDEAWIRGGPDLPRLQELADRQGGIFTTAEARKCGYRRSLLSYYVRRGWIGRIQRGIYRFVDHPVSPYDDLRAAWIAAGRDQAVLSHHSALYLLDLIDEKPWTVHLTVPRSRRWLAAQRRVRIHTRQEPFAEGEIVACRGMRITAPEISIVDATEDGMLTEVLFEAVARALARGVASSGDLVARARRCRVRRVERYIGLAIKAASGREAEIVRNSRPPGYSPPAPF